VVVIYCYQKKESNTEDDAVKKFGAIPEHFWMFIQADVLDGCSIFIDCWGIIVGDLFFTQSRSMKFSLVALNLI